MSSLNQPPASRSDVERNRRTLLTAAAEELAHNPEASMADVARAAGLTRATLYRHFRNRQSLLEAIQTEALVRAAEALVACRLEEGTALEAFRRAIDELGSHSMRFRIVLMQAPDLNPGFLRQRARVLAPLVEVVKRGQVEGHIRSDLPPRWIVTAMASLLVAAVRAATITLISDADVSDKLLLLTVVINRDGVPGFSGPALALGRSTSA